MYNELIGLEQCKNKSISYWYESTPIGEQKYYVCEEHNPPENLCETYKIVDNQFYQCCELVKIKC